MKQIISRVIFTKNHGVVCAKKAESPYPTFGSVWEFTRELQPQRNFFRRVLSSCTSGVFLLCITLSIRVVQRRYKNVQSSDSLDPSTSGTRFVSGALAQGSMPFFPFSLKSTDWKNPQFKIYEVGRSFWSSRRIYCCKAIEKNGKRTIHSDQGAEYAHRADH